MPTKDPKTVGEVLDQMAEASGRLPQQEAPPDTGYDAIKAPQAAVYIAIAAITEALGKEGIAKSREVTEGARFKFRGIEDVYLALNPLLAQHSLCILPHVRNREVVERRSSRGNALFSITLTVDFDIVSALDGSTHTVTVIGEAMDSGDKGTNKAMSIAYKYMALMLFAIPIKGTDDPDGEVHSVAASNDTNKPEAAPAKQAGPTKEEAEEAYLKADAAIQDAATLSDLKLVWETKIEWNKIPRGWVPRLQKLQKEQLDKLRQPAPAQPKAAVPPQFDGPGGPDDDIPF